MIKTIIFDFGDVFINLDKESAIRQALNLFGIDAFSKEAIAANNLYEQGLISTSAFIEFYKNTFPGVTEDKIIDSWNKILSNFPLHRLKFLKVLSEEKKYFLILMSNTNELHIEWIKKEWGYSLYNDFKNCFDKFYLSHEIHLRKPNYNIYQFVLRENGLIENETLFIDDTTENTNVAEQLSLHTWNINPRTEDIIDLFVINKRLF